MNDILSGKLTTHVLDIYGGFPAAGMVIDLRRVDDDEYTHLATVTTNDDGRSDTPLLDADSMVEGEYELLFYVRAYFEARGIKSPFLDTVPLRFTIFDASVPYHVPLLVSPWAYQTYRGS